MLSLDPGELIQPALVIAAGVALLLFPRWHRKRAEGLHAARRAELDAGGEEAFFEERRALDAYPPARRDWLWRLMGAVLLAAGAFRIYFAFAA